MARSKHGKYDLVLSDGASVYLAYYEDGTIRFTVTENGYRSISQAWFRSGNNNIVLSLSTVACRHDASDVIAEATHPVLGTVKVRKYADNCIRLAWKSERPYVIEGLYMSDDGGNIIMLPAPSNTQPAMRYEVPVSEWIQVRDKIEDVLRKRAAWGRPIAYSDLVKELDYITEPGSRALFEMLGELQEKDHAAGRPLLSSMVTLKEHPTKPGMGFFRKARSLGYRFSDTDAGRDAFWVDQFGEVIARNAD